MKQLPQCCTRVLKRVRVAIPIAPAPRNRKNSAIHHAELSQALEHVRVFVILDTVADGLQANAWCGLGRPDRCRRIQEDSVARPAQSAAASGCVHVVPAADGVAGGPAVSAIVEQPRRSLLKVQEAPWNALFDW